MERITDVWGNLARREQVLAIVAVAVLVLMTILFLLLGGGEDPPLDASTTADPTASVGPVKPAPGMIVSTNVPAAPAPVVEGGVAGLAVSGGGGSSGGAPAIEPAAQELQDAADRAYVQPPTRPTWYVPPNSSDAIKAAGRDLERVADEYMRCMAGKDGGQDKRLCLQVIRYGVYQENDTRRDGGILLTKMSSDGHQLDLVIDADGTKCRALDKGGSCDAWVAN